MNNKYQVGQDLRRSTYMDYNKKPMEYFNVPQDISNRYTIVKGRPGYLYDNKQNQYLQRNLMGQYRLASDMSKYQMGGEQIQEQVPQDDGMMQLLQAFFQMNQMTEEQIQQFMQEFQGLPPEEQQQVIQHISEQVQGGEQEAPIQEQPMEQPQMQMGGSMQLEMSNRGMLPMQYEGFNKKINHNQFNHGGFYQVAGNYDPNYNPDYVNPFVGEDINVNELPVPQYSMALPSNSIPAINAVNSMRAELPLPGHSDVAMHERVKVSEVNKAASKPVNKLTSRDKEILSLGYGANQQLQSYLDANGGKTMSKKKSGEYDGVIGVNTIEAMKTVFQKETGKMAKSNSELAKYFDEKVKGSGIKITPKDVNLTPAYNNVDGGRTKHTESYQKKFSNYMSNNKQHVDESQLLPSQIARLKQTITTPTGATTDSYNPTVTKDTITNKIDMNFYGEENKNIVEKLPDLVGDSNYYYNINKLSSGTSDRSGNYGSGYVNPKRQKQLSDNFLTVDDNILFDPKTKVFLERSFLGGYSKPNRSKLEFILKTNKGKSFVKEYLK